MLSYFMRHIIAYMHIVRTGILMQGNVEVCFTILCLKTRLLSDNRMPLDLCITCISLTGEMGWSIFIAWCGCCVFDFSGAGKLCQYNVFKRPYV